MPTRRQKTQLMGWGPVLTVLGLLSSGNALADGVRMQVDMGTPVMLQGESQRAFIKVGLTGSSLGTRSSRTPVNVAIVLDRSGSMGVDKMQKAKEAAIMAIDRLGPDDIVSLVAYNHTVNVLVPATKVRDRAQIYARINALFSSGDTALFAGVSKGAYEVRKFIERNRVNRIVLLSDGLANVGPSSAGELGELGWSFAKESISVTTIGLGEGYNEDLMVALARESDGNHAFAENAADLARIFSSEFGDLTSVVARDVRVRIQCAPGVRPLRILGRRAEIAGRTITARINQIYADQEKFLLVEVEVPAKPAGLELGVAEVSVRYADTIAKSDRNLNGKAQVRFTESRADVDGHRNKDVSIASVDLVANETNKAALSLRDQGKTKEAQMMLDKNAAFLDRAAKKYKSKRLSKSAQRNRKAKKNLDSKSWGVQRKRMRSEQHMLDAQQAWE